MGIVRKITDEFTIAGAVTADQVQQIAEEGFQSVLNLQSLSQHRLNDEQQHAESLGLRYVNLTH